MFGYNNGYYDQYSYNNSPIYSAQKQAQFSPDVMDALIPSAEGMIDVIRADELRPQCGAFNESREYKIKKARCCHRIIVDNSQGVRGLVTLKRKVRAVADGTLVCDLCKARILTKFDRDSMKKAIDDFLAVVDTLVAFGPDLLLMNVDPKHPEERGIIDRMLDTKEFCGVHLIKIVEMFANTITKTNASNENERNFAKEYLDHSNQNITSWAY